MQQHGLGYTRYRTPENPEYQYWGWYGPRTPGFYETFFAATQAQRIGALLAVVASPLLIALAIVLAPIIIPIVLLLWVSS